MTITLQAHTEKRQRRAVEHVGHVEHVELMMMITSSDVVLSNAAK